MTIAHIILLTGASNSCGSNTNGSVPVGIPLDETVMPHWLTINWPAPSPDANAFHDLDVRASGDHGPELALGVGLLAAGVNAAIVQLSRGSSDISQWLPGGPYYDGFISELTQAKAAVATRFPGQEERWHWIDQRGETEIRSANPEQAANFGTRLTDLKEEIAAVIDQTPQLHSVLTHASTDGVNVATNIGPLYAGMRAASDFTISINALALQGDGVHLTAAAQNDSGTLMLASLGVFRQRYKGFPRKDWAHPS